jgi:hypothetical protein
MNGELHQSVEATSVPAIRQALLVLIPVAAFSVLAYLAAVHGCSTGDGSFTVDSNAKPSAYCQATGLFPPDPTTLPSVLLDLILFVSPALSLLVGGVVGARRGSELSSRVLFYACFMAPFTLLLALSADVGYGGPYV